MARFYKTLATRFAVVGSEQLKKFFPSDQDLPRPGQHVYVESDSLGIPLTSVKISGVSYEMLADGVFQATVTFDRVSLTEEVLFARLTRQQLEVLEEDELSAEPLVLVDRTALAEEFLITAYATASEFSGVNFSGVAYSGA